MAEFYSIEGWVDESGGAAPVLGGDMGTIDVDGGTYAVYLDPTGGGDFPRPQYYSVRTEGRQCGRTSISQHFSEWAELDMPLGQLDQVMLFVEGMSGGTGSYELTRASIHVE